MEEAKFAVYDTGAMEYLFEGTFDACQNYIANYGGGWTALTIHPAALQYI